MFVAMIWRQTDQSRLGPFNLAQEFWANYGGVHLIDSGHEPFNRAASRNKAVRVAEEAGVSKLVIADADCIPNPIALQEAWNAADDTAVQLPYTSCIVHAADGTVAGEYTFTCGGIYVTTTKAWWAAGGQDERFTMWAPEDMAFMIAHRTLLGKPFGRHLGRLLSLGHAADKHRHQNDESDELVKLYRRYEAADGDPAAMEALCFQWS
jgi:hypothetical protein